MHKPVHILHLEDNKEDSILLQRTLQRSGLKYQLSEAITEIDFKKILDNPKLPVDVVISDYNIPLYGGIAALKYVRNVRGNLPFLFLTSTVGEEKAVSLLLEGADDFLLKDHVDKVPKVIMRLIKEVTIKSEKILYESELEKKNNILATLMNSAADLIFLKDHEGKYITVNRSFADHYQKDPAFYIGKRAPETFPEDIAKKARETDEFVLQNNQSITYEIEYFENNKRVILETVKTPFTNKEGNVIGLVGISRDITKKKLVEEALKRNETLLEQSERQTRSGSFEYNVATDRMTCSTQFMEYLGLNKKKNPLTFEDFLARIYKPERALFNTEVVRTLKEGREFLMEHRCVPHNSKEIVYCRTHIKPATPDSSNIIYYGTLVDITKDRIIKKAILDAQENERKSIAANLHDSLGQKLVAAKMFLTENGQAFNPDHLQKARDLINVGIEETRSISRNLSLYTIESLGLKESILEILQSFPTRMQITHGFDFDESKVSTDVANNLYRIVQEGMTNIVKYAQATEASVFLTENKDYLALEIADNGNGFDIKKRTLGNGLKNITQRVSKCHGLLTIESAKGKGTKIRIKVPFS